MHHNQLLFYITLNNLFGKRSITRVVLLYVYLWLLYLFQSLIHRRIVHFIIKEAYTVKP